MLESVAWEFYVAMTNTNTNTLTNTFTNTLTSTNTNTLTNTFTYTKYTIKEKADACVGVGGVGTFSGGVEGKGARVCTVHTSTSLYKYI